MIPRPVKLHSADICRDGGSYVALYLDEANQFHELELPVIFRSVEGQSKRLGYKPPILKSYDPITWGRISTTVQLTWEEGLILRGELESLLGDDIGMGGRSRAEEMFALLLLKGELPGAP
jgi:hypothetical protein